MKTIFTFLLLFTVSQTSWAQVNGYARVSSVQSNGKLLISATNESYGQFKKNGFVIVMQMQDNVLGGNILNDINFGSLATIASAGEYEIARISSVKRNDGDSDDDDDDNSNPILEIKLTGSLSKIFITGVNSSVQIITFPTLGTLGFTTTANISAVSWNGSYGGVVAFEVAGVLTLNHNITADNAGFRGGAMDASSSPYGVCNPLVYFTAIDPLFGNKGEGIYKSINPLFAAGKGKILNGGGGGNTINGGGSGGGNFSAGGNGGAGWSCASNTGGMGGVALNTYISGTRLFLGGGGGSGESNDYSNNKGGNGGGIIFIKAQEIRTSGTGAVRISSNGETGNSVANDGAGGGGAGGTIVLQVNYWNVSSTKPLQITANGGNGGNVGDGAVHGGGGGGGQGSVLFNTALPATNITTNTANGIGGLNSTGGTRANDGAGTNNAGIMQNSMSLLPVSLLSFQGSRLNDKVNLEWRTENHVNVSRFEIQRSENGTSFNVIGNVTASSANQSIHINNFTDAHPVSGVNYYRLRMIDNDGKFSYSKVLLIRTEHQSGSIISVYPNPAASQATLSYKSENSGLATIRIFNITGVTMANQTVKIVAGENALALNGIAHLHPGVYTVQVLLQDQTRQTRLVIQ